jgi:basic membrane protein A
MPLTRRNVLISTAAMAISPFAAWPIRASARDLRIRGIFETPLEEPFVMQMHLALKRLAVERGYEYQSSDSVKASDYSRVLAQWCEDGVHMIFGDAYGTEQISRRVAREYPSVAFVMSSAVAATTPNFSTFYGQINEPAYLAGILAASLSKAGKIGAVSAVSLPTTNALLNAFRAGAKEADPNIQFKVAMIGSFFDPPKARESTIAMAEQGVDVVFAERLGVIEAAADRDMIAIGNVADQASINPKVVATSVVWDPYPIFKVAADAVASKSIGAIEYASLENIANGVNYLAPYREFDAAIPAEAKALIASKSKEIVEGKFIVPYDESEPKSE